jgi:exopolyphosphatase/guanosine-5'-triphosphate,3'-diphosphate pyrophosphatase
LKPETSNLANRRFAVIDIGSNTFHLIIVDAQRGGRFQIIHRHREFVYLAKDGIQFLSTDTIERGFMAFAKISELCQAYKVKQIKAIGSAALRSASNANEFIDLIHREYDILIEVISGLREARLIYEGVASLTYC